jgi:hypothetical protein
MAAARRLGSLGMKVITQLIRHFWQRGALSPEQAEYLLDQGFAKLADLPGFKPVERVDTPQPAVAVLAPHPLEATTEDLERPRRRAGRGGPKGVVPEADDLQLWLRKQFLRRGRAFSSLVRLGERFGPCATWHDAVKRIRQTKPERFVKGLAGALRSQQVGLRNLWQAVDPEPFYARMEDASLRGPTVRAFRMLLSVQDAAQLGKYCWILKFDEVQATCNLLQANRRLLGGLSGLFHHHRSVLNGALQHSTHPVPHWGLVLLYNSYRRSTENGATAGREFGPVELPADEVWRQAWTAALLMDPSAVTRLLVGCYGRRQVGDGAACGHLLYCPLGWKLP